MVVLDRHCLPGHLDSFDWSCDKVRNGVLVAGEKILLELRAGVGDLSADGAVNGADLALLLGEWGVAGVSPADLNVDGAVNGADLAILLGGWGAPPST